MQSANLQNEGIAMQQQKLSTGKVDDAADCWIGHVGRINLQYRRHDERESATSKPQ